MVSRSCIEECVRRAGGTYHVSVIGPRFTCVMFRYTVPSQTHEQFSPEFFSTTEGCYAGFRQIAWDTTFELVTIRSCVKNAKGLAPQDSLSTTTQWSVIFSVLRLSRLHNIFYFFHDGTIFTILTITEIRYRLALVSRRRDSFQFSDRMNRSVRMLR